MRKERRRKAGFSLIEVLISISVLGMMMFSLIGVFIYGFCSLSRTRQIALATQICQEQVEVIRNMPFNTILGLGSSFTNDKLVRLLNGQGTRAVEPSFGNDIKKLTVSVGWNYRGQPLRKDIVTFITRSGLDKK
jgi:prepilin-type N-terminal cleavage/methylation domain-containing protein